MSKKTGTALSTLFVSTASTVVFFIAVFIGGWLGLMIAVINWLAGLFVMNSLFKNVDMEVKDSAE